MAKHKGAGSSRAQHDGAGDAGSSGASSGPSSEGLSEREREQQALRRTTHGLIGDTAQNRNLTGSSTWETLPEPDQRGDEARARATRRSHGQS